MSFYYKITKIYIYFVYNALNAQNKYKLLYNEGVPIAFFLDWRKKSIGLVVLGDFHIFS